MTELDAIIARLSRGEIDLQDAANRLRELTVDAVDVHSACQRAGLDAGRARALTNALQATGMPAAAGDPTAIHAPAGDAATLVSSAPAKDDAPTRIIDHGRGPALTTDRADAPTEVKFGDADDASAAPTRIFSRGSETVAGASTDRTSGTHSRGTHSDWAHPDQWEQRHRGPIGVGTTIKQRFVLEELLGRGGMGSVYRARDLRRVEAQDRETDVAIKLINEDFQHHPDAMVALQREAKKAQTLAHPNIVTVYDFDRDGATVYVSMAYLRGRPLDVVIRKAAPGAIPAQQALDIIHQLADGLAYAHKKGFAHADFKPGNVFLTEKGDARILDFGIARAASGAATADSKRVDDHTRFDPTTLGAITPAYASLEMLQREAPIPADDVYALACVAHELLTGKHPFVDATGAKLPATEAQKRGLQPAPIKGLARRYQRAINRGLAFARADRYADAGAFVSAIKAPAKIRRSVAAATVLLAVVAGVSWWYSFEQSDLAVSMADLTPALDVSRELLGMGDTYLQEGKAAQAHKSYAQAWDNGRTTAGISTDQLKILKVLVDRRVDDVIDHFLAETQREDLDKFTMQVLRLNLEALRDSELGNRDEAIQAALKRIEKHG